MQNNFEKGISDGKKSQNLIWVLTGIINLLGLIFVFAIKPEVSSDDNDYVKGYKSGVKKRRLLYWFFGMLLFSFINVTIQNMTSNQSSSTEKNSSNKSINKNSITGKYYFNNFYDKLTEAEVFLKSDKTWSYKRYYNGKLNFEKSGVWNTQQISSNTINNKETWNTVIFQENSNSMKWGLWVNKGCLQPPPKKLQTLMNDYGIFASITGTPSSLNSFSPITLDGFEYKCKE